MATSASGDRWIDAARAIMTTDTYPKVATRTAKIDGVTVTLNGMAKGAGMIAPDMATMLSFIVTDADIEPSALQAMLSRHVGATFNAVTVDSDTSTSDTLMVFATGAAGDRGAGVISQASDPRVRAFSKALSSLMEDLAIQIVRDGEGRAQAGGDHRYRRGVGQGCGTHRPVDRQFAAGQDGDRRRRCPIGAASSWRSARPAKRLSATSWRSGSAMCESRSTASVIPPTAKRLRRTLMKQDEIAIRVDLGIGRGKARVFTCDLTKAYVEINGDYRS